MVKSKDRSSKRENEEKNNNGIWNAKTGLPAGDPCCPSRRPSTRLCTCDLLLPSPTPELRSLPLLLVPIAPAIIVPKPLPAPVTSSHQPPEILSPTSSLPTPTPAPPPLRSNTAAEPRSRRRSSSPQPPESSARDLQCPTAPPSLPLPTTSRLRPLSEHRPPPSDRTTATLAAPTTPDPRRTTRLQPARSRTVAPHLCSAHEAAVAAEPLHQPDAPTPSLACCALPSSSASSTRRCSPRRRNPPHRRLH
ncbi:formin-like protein 14 [Eucalyptus grandis]|uniref:formin-like protein 14 n=1 Tax=Eucalyptus grandis TaxID=71139 RepID=UPI00192EBB0E|nr:formin-like protein 14 [Eucalyptus grandis]